MPATLVAQLIIALGPVALELIPKLASIWTKPSLTADELTALCLPAHQSYQEYMAAGKVRLGQDTTKTTSA